MTLFQVVGQSVAQSDRPIVISRHTSLKAAQRALKLANGSAGFRIEKARA